MNLDQDILNRISLDFGEKDRHFVTKQLLSITVSHVMAKSQGLLNATRLSILNLAQGDIEQVEYYVGCAKIDFRDVLYWNSSKFKSSKQD